MLKKINYSNILSFLKPIINIKNSKILSEHMLQYENIVHEKNIKKRI